MPWTGFCDALTKIEATFSDKLEIASSQSSLTIHLPFTVVVVNPATWTVSVRGHLLQKCRLLQCSQHSCPCRKLGSQLLDPAGVRHRKKEKQKWVLMETGGVKLGRFRLVKGPPVWLTTGMDNVEAPQKVWRHLICFLFPAGKPEITW